MAKEYFPKKVKTIFEEDGEFRVVEVNVPEREAEPIPQQQPLDVIGHEYSRQEAFEKVTGGAKYSGDIRLEGMLHARLFRSESPNANVNNIDISAAENMPGVRAVVNLEKSRARFVGDILAAVAAETPEQAEDAMRAIKVDYSDLRYVVNLDRAIRPNAPNAVSDNNLGAARPITKGDVAVGFNEAAQTVESDYKTQIEIHNPLEPHSSLVVWEGNNLLVYTSTQTIDIAQARLVRNLRQVFPDLNLNESNVRVIAEHLGGGFGCKIGPTGFEVIAALLARRANAPVLAMLTRNEVSIDAGNRPSTIQKIKLGAKSNGELTAIDLHGYVGGGVTGNDNITAVPATMYKCPHLKIISQPVSMNAGGRKANRAPGHVQGAFSLECAMDELAEKLNMDPLELRRINHTESDGAGSGRPYSSKALLECYDLGAEAIGWSRRNRTPGADTGVKKRGMGMASLIWGGAGNPGSIVEIDLFKNGNVNVRCGTQDVGTGTRTIMNQVVAEDLGISVDKVTAQVGDTNFPPGSPSFGSLTAPSVCPSVRVAVMEATRKLYPAVASRLNVQPEDLEMHKGFIRVKNATSRGMNYLDALALMSEDKVTASGERGPNPRNYAGNTFGAHFVEVEVDTETGRVKVLKAVAAHDSGRIINPMSARNQVMGGVIQSIGYALMEQRIMDNRTGRMANANLRDYKMMPSSESPEVEVFFANNVDPHLNNLGMKGLGEPPRIGIPAAIGNAIYNAIGVRLREVPFIPEKVLNGLTG